MLRAMSAPAHVTIVSPSPERTAEIAVHLADVLRPGDTICLSGGLGAGKSHFARSVIRHLTGEVDVPSPTFTLVQTYAAEAFTIWHADLYRLSTPDEVAELGLESAIGQDLCLIEWPDRLPTPPAAALNLMLGPGENDMARQLTFTHDGTWGRRLDGLVGVRAT